MKTFVRSFKVFRPMSELIYWKKDFWTSSFCSTWSPRHVDMHFWKPCPKFFLKVLRVFAQCPERFLNEQKLRNRSISSKFSSQCAEFCFEYLAENCPPKSKTSFEKGPKLKKVYILSKKIQLCTKILFLET